MYILSRVDGTYIKIVGLASAPFVQGRLLCCCGQRAEPFPAGIAADGDFGFRNTITLLYILCRVARYGQQAPGMRTELWHKMPVVPSYKPRRVLREMLKGKIMDRQQSRHLRP